jgi:hypothetical protein
MRKYVVYVQVHVFNCWVIDISIRENRKLNILKPSISNISEITTWQVVSTINCERELRSGNILVRDFYNSM